MAGVELVSLSKISPEDVIHEYDFERPHQAIDMRRPGDLYVPSSEALPRS
jgi:hypothetical protein